MIARNTPTTACTQKIWFTPSSNVTGFTAESQIWIIPQVRANLSDPQEPIEGGKLLKEFRAKNRHERRAEAAKQRKRSW